jgi:hypothetical protein
VLPYLQRFPAWMNLRQQALCLERAYQARSCHLASVYAERLASGSLEPCEVRP